MGKKPKKEPVSLLYESQLKKEAQNKYDDMLHKYKVNKIVRILEDIKIHEIKISELKGRILSIEQEQYKTP